MERCRNTVVWWFSTAVSRDGHRQTINNNSENIFSVMGADRFRNVEMLRVEQLLQWLRSRFHHNLSRQDKTVASNNTQENNFVQQHRPWCLHPLKHTTSHGAVRPKHSRNRQSTPWPLVQVKPCLEPCGRTRQDRHAKSWISSTSWTENHL